MPITPITDHVEQALAKLISRYQRKPRFAAWCASHVRRVQELEDACWAFVNSLDVDTADLTRLTLLGKIVGQTPLGTLDQFRLYVKARILVNQSDGKAPTLIKIANVLVGDVVYTEPGTAAINVEATEPIGTRDPDVSVSMLRSAKLGGVRLNLVFLDDTAANAFAFAEGNSPIADGRGFADNALSTGGKLARIR